MEKMCIRDRYCMPLAFAFPEDDCARRVEDEVMIGEMCIRDRTGKEAVERCYARHETNSDYFAVILDWKMPGMDGIETAREIRKLLGNEVPIIILSAYDWSEVEEEARKAGVNGFITKPLFKSRLVYMFQQFIGNSESRRGIEEEAGGERDFSGKRLLLVDCLLYKSILIPHV